MGGEVGEEGEELGGEAGVGEEEEGVVLAGGGVSGEVRDPGGLGGAHFADHA